MDQVTLLLSSFFVNFKSSVWNYLITLPLRDVSPSSLILLLLSHPSSLCLCSLSSSPTPPSSLRPPPLLCWPQPHPHPPQPTSSKMLDPTPLTHHVPDMEDWRALERELVILGEGPRGAEGRRVGDGAEEEGRGPERGRGGGSRWIC